MPATSSTSNHALRAAPSDAPILRGPFALPSRLRDPAPLVAGSRQPHGSRPSERRLGAGQVLAETPPSDPSRGLSPRLLSGTHGRRNEAALTTVWRSNRG